MTDRQILLTTLNTALTQATALIPEEQDSALVQSLNLLQSQLSDTIASLTRAIAASE